MWLMLLPITWTTHFRCFWSTLVAVNVIWILHFIPLSFRSIPVSFRFISVSFRSIPVPFRFILVSFLTIPVPFRFIPVSFRSIPVSFRSIPVSLRFILVSFRSIPVHSGSFRLIPFHSVLFLCLVTPGTKLVLRSSLTRLVWSTCSAFEAHDISNSAVSALAPSSSPERSKFCRVCRAPGIMTFSWIFIAKKNAHGHQMRPRKTVKGNHWNKMRPW